MKSVRADLQLERLLLGLERELTEATDEEILAAARELGMNPAMKGSAALFGVTILVQPNLLGKDRGKKARSRVSLNWTRHRSEEPWK
jgi:hypothetical protein